MAWLRPDWPDLTMYGLYCLEALIRAAVLKTGGKDSGFNNVPRFRLLAPQIGPFSSVFRVLWEVI